MGRNASALVALLCLGSPLIGRAQAPPRDLAVRKAGSGSIRGRVAAAGTDRPLRNARVQATSDEGSAPAVFTDADGRFIIASLAPGRYRVSITKPGYVATNFGARGLRDPGAAIDVADGSSADGINVRLPKAAALAGRIIDTFGDPVIGMTVTAEIPPGGSNGQPAGTPVATAHTDDLGDYRLGGLSEGTFIVSVHLATAFSSSGEPLPEFLSATMMVDGRLTTVTRQMPLAGTRSYYPGVTDMAQAQTMSVALSEERTSIDFVVPVMPPTVIGSAPLQETGPGADSAFSRGIRGRISRASGGPLPHALVRLSPLDPQRAGTVLAVTDNDGRYELQKLPAGRYKIDASRRGYATREYGQPRAFGAGEPIDVRAGEWREPMDIQLPAAGAIAGRVVDDAGDPVEGASVRVLQMRYASGLRRLVEVSGVRPQPTNDAGRYRIYGLEPGEYVVSAFVGQVIPAVATFPGSPMAAPAGAVADLSGYATTYLPGTANPGDAQRIAVALSQTVSDMDFALARVPMARVTGAAFDAAGAPVSGVDAAGRPALGSVLLTPSRRSGSAALAPVSARLQQDGTFEFANVAPGEYVVQAWKGRRNPSTEGEFAAAFVTVSGTDITGLVMRMSSGSAVNGHITLQGDDPDLSRAIEQRDGDSRSFARVIEFTRAIGLSVRPVDLDRSPLVGNDPAHAEIFSDLTFRMAGISGPRVLRLTSAPKGWALKAVLLNGVDVIDTPITFGTKEQSVSNLEVVLTNRMSSVSGRLTDAQGRGVAGATVIVFATASRLWSEPSRFVTATRTETDGAFAAGSLPAGQYYVAAVDRIVEGEWQDPDFLESVVPRAASVTLGDGEQLSVSPRLIVR